MAESMTYDSLLTDIADYIERDDDPTVAQIPRFVMMAENRIASSVRGLGMMQFVSGTLAAGQSTYPKPSRWRETVSFSYLNSDNQRVYLKERGYEYCRTYWPVAALQDAPKYYANYDYEHFFLVATPDSNYSTEICYYERPEPLSLTNQTNWLTQYAPQLLLYGTLLEAQPWLKLGERVPEFRAFYDEAVKNIATEATRRAQDMTNTRTEA